MNSTQAQAALVVRDVHFAHGERPVLAGIHLEVPQGEVLVIIGASGSGKTSLLRCVAGLDRPARGSILIEGRPMNEQGHFVQPEERPVGMIFQGLALFPHLTVAGNIGFGLKHLPRSERRQRIHAELATVDLAGLEDRYPHQLSGGQQQRVAIARSLVRRPSLLLMDEPFSDLDPLTRQQVRTETLRILRDHGITSIIVSHDPADARQIADRVLLMESGLLQPVGPDAAVVANAPFQ